MSLIVPTRRGFMAGLLAAAAGPAIVRASSLMPVVAPMPRIKFYADGPMNWCEQPVRSLGVDFGADDLTVVTAYCLHTDGSQTVTSYAAGKALRSQHYPAPIRPFAIIPSGRPYP